MKRTAIPRGWEGPDYREGRDVPCQVCDASGVIEDGEQVDVDDFIDCLCGHCDGSGKEPWRPAGGRDTSAPPSDCLGNGHLRGWRDRLARDKRANRSEYELAWVRNAHRSAVARFIGKAVQA
jgi:hypothetical protein